MAADSTCPCRGTLDLNLDVQTPSGPRKIFGSLKLEGSLTLGCDFCADGECSRPLTVALTVDAVRLQEVGLRGDEHGHKDMTGTGEAGLRGDDHGHKHMTHNHGDKDMAYDHGYDSARCLDMGLGDGSGFVHSPPTVPALNAAPAAKVEVIDVPDEDSIPIQAGASSLAPSTQLDTPDPPPEKKVETDDPPTPSPPPPKRVRSWALRPEFSGAASSSSMPSDAPTAPPQQEEVNPFGEQILQGPSTLLRELDLSLG